MSEFDPVTKASEFVTKTIQSFGMDEPQRNAILDAVRDRYCALSAEQRRAVLSEIPHIQPSNNTALQPFSLTGDV